MCLNPTTRKKKEFLGPSNHPLTKATEKTLLPEAQGLKVLEAIDRGLDGFGENVGSVFYSLMEREYQFDRSKILERPDEFVTAICAFFRSGSTLVERSIGREILAIFDLPACPSLNFKTALEIVKRHPNLKRVRESE